MTTDDDPPASVLVVEDERALAGMVAAYLSRAGYRTSVVHTGPDALRAFQDAEPDVVVLASDSRAWTGSRSVVASGPSPTATSSS